MHGSHNRTYPSAALPILLLALAGCTGPGGGRATDIATRSVIDAIRREMLEAEAAPDYRELSRDSSADSLRIPEDRLVQLNQTSGPSSYVGDEDPLGEDLLGRPQSSVRVSLGRVIASAAGNNLELQFQRLGPAVSEAELVQAEAAFDWTFFVNSRFQRLDQPRTSTTFFGTAFNASIENDASTGIRRRTATGGTVQLDTTWTWAQNENRTLTVVPDPANTVTIGAQFTQPLLRGAGTDTALATVRIAANAERASVQRVRSELISTLLDAESAYWNLALAHEILRIQRRLLDRGEEVRDIIIDREQLDATQAQIADARAEVENRRAAIIRAERSLRQSSDSLKVLMNDPEITIGSELLMLPADTAVDEPIRFSLADALTTAFAERPEVALAVLSLDDSSIRRGVARNGLLPRLDLSLETRFAALGGLPNDAYDDVLDGDFVDYLVSLAFEQPIGNREANARVRETQLEQLQAVTSYQNTVRQITLEVKNALRDVETGYRLIAQTRIARIAAAENLRALRVQIETTGGYTAFNLDQWLNRQQLLASAEIEEAQSLASYNTAVARLYAAIGTSADRNGIRVVTPESADSE